MMIGFVTPDWKAEVRLNIYTPAGTTIEYPVFVDTGFNGSLSLPHIVLDQIEAKPLKDAIVYLADGSTAVMPTCSATVLWDETRLVEVFATSGDAVLGMRLLENHELKIEVPIGGAVMIETLKN